MSTAANDFEKHWAPFRKAGENAIKRMGGEGEKEGENAVKKQEGEKKKNCSSWGAWVWILIILILVVLIAVVYYFVNRRKGAKIL